MTDLLIVIVRGIGTGALLSLLAMSANVIFNSSGILNFAHGHLFIVGALFSFLLFPAGASISYWLLMLPVVILATVALASFQGAVTLIPLRSSSEQHSWIITTLAFSIILGGVMTLAMGPATNSAPNPFGTFRFLGTQIPVPYVLLTIMAVVTYFLLKEFQRRTLVGLALNALSQDLDAARTLGARTFKLQVASFAIAGVILGFTTHVGASAISINTETGLHTAIFGFIVLVMGGLGNNLGALVAGPIFGIIQMLVALQLGGQYQLPVALLLVVAVLMVRPQGIFGKLHARRV